MDDLSREIKNRVQECREMAAQGTWTHPARDSFLSKFMNVLGVGSSLEKDLASFKKDAFRPCKQPAVEFEAKTGLTGIAGRYHLPQGLTSGDLQDYAMINFIDHIGGKISGEQYNGRLSEVVAALEGRNPGLQNLKYDPNNTAKLNSIVNGVASGFNLSDIQIFLDRGFNLKFDLGSEHNNLFDKIQNRCGPLGWLPSAGTLKNIDKQMFSAAAPASPSVKAAVLPKMPAR